MTTKKPGPEPSERDHQELGEEALEQVSGGGAIRGVRDVPSVDSGQTGILKATPTGKPKRSMLDV